MLKVTLPSVPFPISKFIFGTASLFNCGFGPRRQALLSAAVDAGFSHFDTAPYYGFGHAERDLAPVLKAHPEVTVTTKVGIYSPGGEIQSEAAVFVRKVAGRALKALSRPAIDFSITRARLSLEGSLRRLGRDRIDIFTLHEPQIDLLNTQEWANWLQQCVADGKVRTFGLALTADRVEPFLRADSPLARYIQVADSLDVREADVLKRFGRPFQVTYGYVTAARQRHPQAPVMDVLRQSVERNRDGAIIVSTTQPARLGQYARLSAGVMPC